MTSEEIFPPWSEDAISRIKAKKSTDPIEDPKISKEPELFKVLRKAIPYIEQGFMDRVDKTLGDGTRVSIYAVQQIVRIDIKPGERE